MTGTLGTNLERDLLGDKKTYGLDFFQLPRFKKELNIREEDILVSNRPDWLEEIKKEVSQVVADNRIIEESERSKKETLKTVVLKEHEELEKSMEKIDKKNKDTKSELEKLEKQKLEKELKLEDLNDAVGEIELGRNRGGRAVLIICENKKDVTDIVKVLAVMHKHLFDYNGKVDGLRKVVGNKRKSTTINQLRPGDVIVATNVAGRGTDFRISSLLQENGGLHVIISYVPTNIRVELQGKPFCAIFSG